MNQVRKPKENDKRKCYTNKTVYAVPKKEKREEQDSSHKKGGLTDKNVVGRVVSNMLPRRRQEGRAEARPLMSTMESPFSLPRDSPAPEPSRPARPAHTREGGRGGETVRLVWSKVGSLNRRCVNLRLFLWAMYLCGAMKPRHPIQETVTEWSAASRSLDREHEEEKKEEKLTREWLSPSSASG